MFKSMSLQQRLQVNIVLLKGSTTKTRDIQDTNTMAARIMVEILESGLDS
jgi:hypothetical protein